MLEPFIDLDRGRARFSVRPAPPPVLDHVDGLLAGAAQVDITPPPGMPKAGYSANARTGVGFRTRLRARVVHLRAGTASIAIVQCDLLGGSSVLQHLVAEALARVPDVDVPLAGLLIGATHTHAGPGQFLGTDFYNRFASNKSGFDPAYTSFLVTQLTAAVVAAVGGRRPAKAALGSIDVWGLTRNRSLSPHVQNDSVSDKRTEPQRKFAAINPALHLLRVDGVDGAPIAATLVFSVHGTGVSMRSDEYNADVWAYVCDELSVRAGDPSLVVGAIEGTHADVAPALRPGCAGHVEAARVGRGIGAFAAELWSSLAPSLSTSFPVACGLREVTDRPARPAVGAALVAGATENTTPVLDRLPPFKAGYPKRGRWAGGPQAEKWVLGSRWLQPLVVPTRSFPSVLPVQVLRVGGGLLVGMPFEVTVEAGRRIAAAVGGELPVIVTSVANEYSGYCTTPEEYSQQWYEGGHTIFGPRTQPWLARHAARLAADVASSSSGVVQDVVRERSWSLKVHRYLPRALGAATVRTFVAPAFFSDSTASIDACWTIEWNDVAGGDLHWHEPLVRVEGRDGPSGAWFDVADDQRPSVEVLAVGDGLYRARWWDPSFRGGRAHRFVLCANGGQPETASDPFD